MLKIKRLHSFILQTFLPLFVMTFGICLFIVLLQFLWRHIDDMVGKGLELGPIAEMLYYAALGLVPMALPLSILLASLMVFGNLGESLELLAMKSAGISLPRIMRPLIVFILMISIGAFFFQNNAMPVIQVKLYTLLYSMRQKSPELDIPEASFYKGITGYNVYVKEKVIETGLLKDVLIFDYSRGFNNSMFMLADSGRLKTSEDKLFLILTLYSGESFQNLKEENNARVNKEAIPYRRETFSSRDILIELDQNFNMSDESIFGNNFMGKNLEDLQLYMDSINVKLDSIKDENAAEYLNTSYVKSFSESYRKERNSASALANKPSASPEHVVSAKLAADDLKKERHLFVDTFNINFDNVYSTLKPSTQLALLNKSKSSAEHVKSAYFFKASTLGNEAYKMRRHGTEWHTKFTLSAACLLFFFIGAPLGAIIRKGGLGVPVVVSVLFFIFYYIINNIGLKMARDGVWEVWAGMWISSAVLVPIGAFLTYKAANDSVILNADNYINQLKSILGKRSDRKIERKEVIIFTPEMPKVLAAISELDKQSQEYLSKPKSWKSYVRYWMNNEQSSEISKLSANLESIIEELSNSDKVLLLNKLMDYPVVSGYKLLNLRMNKWLGLAVAVCFPLGITLFLMAQYQKKLFRADLKVINKTSRELVGIINET